MSDDLRLIRKHAKISDTLETRRLVVELYAKVFEFLCYTMSWYSSATKRFRGSLSKNFYNNEVASRVNAIQAVIKRFMAEADFIEKLRIRNVHESIRELTPIGNESRADDLKAIREKMNRMHDILEFGIVSGQYLRVVEQHYVHSTRALRL